MSLNKKELKKLHLEFNNLSSRLLRVNVNDYTPVLGQFLSFLESTTVIYDFILDCGVTDEVTANNMFNEVAAFGRKNINLGNTLKEEVSNIYALHKVIYSKKPVMPMFTVGFSSSNSIQENLKKFNERILLVLINHIEEYLRKIEIDMGADESISYSITVHGGQVNLATDKSTINAIQNNGISADELQKLLSDIRSNLSNLSDEDKESVSDCLEVIEAESVSNNPKRSFLKTALNTLKGINGSVQFVAAVATLAEFIMPLLGVVV